MANPIVEFQRLFQMWEFTVGHGCLLLRSTKTVEHPTRIEVLFKNVSQINLPTTFDGLKVVVASDQEIRNLAQQPEVLARQEGHTFLVSGTGYNGHVIAGVVAWHEDDGEYNQPSPLMAGYFRAKTR